jgi:hypothetical protein
MSDMKHSLEHRLEPEADEQQQRDAGAVGEALEDAGLPAGRMLSASKSYYYEQHPDHDVFFNACIFIKERKWFKVTYRQIWWGDIDLTLSRPALIAAADAAGVDLYVTREKYRWKGYQGQRGDDVFVFKHGL